MQIKVKDTRMHKILKEKTNISTFSSKKGWIKNFEEDQVPVAEAKLVLVEGGDSDFTPDNLSRFQIFNDKLNKFKKWFKPILISETEKIEVGDWALYQHPKQIGIAPPAIFKIVNPNYSLHEPSHRVEHEGGFGVIEGYKKVLALPEYFSPKHLQAIVDSKLKDGNKVLVECEQDKVRDTDPECPIAIGGGYPTVVKLNSSSHITLHKVEEKMIPVSVAVKSFYAGREAGAFADHPIYNWKNFEEWFKQNVK